MLFIISFFFDFFQIQEPRGDRAPSYKSHGRGFRRTGHPTPCPLVHDDHANSLGTRIREYDNIAFDRINEQQWFNNNFTCNNYSPITFEDERDACLANTILLMYSA